MKDLKGRKPLTPSDGKVTSITAKRVKKDSCIVNSPIHYNTGRVEAIEVMEDAIQDAPSPEAALLHGTVLKYLLRLWYKDNAAVDARKALWYLNRLIEKLEGETRDDA